MSENQDESGVLIISRALAYLCLQSTDLKNQEKGEQAKFLLGLGLSRGDCANLLDSTEESIRKMTGKQNKKKRGRNRDTAKKTKKK